MDETLAVVAVDLGGRPALVYKDLVKVRLVGDLQTELLHRLLRRLRASRGRESARQGFVRPLESSQDRGDFQVLGARHALCVFDGCATQGSAALHEGSAVITIFDYGAGNLRSVQNTLDEIGAQYELVRDAAGLERASKIILPGVGHFGQMLRALDEMGVRETLIERIRANVPFLGICLGLQGAVRIKRRSAGGSAGWAFFPATVRALSRSTRASRTWAGISWMRCARRACCKDLPRAAVRLFRAQLLCAGCRADRGHLHLHDPVHRGAGIRQHIRRAVSSGEIGPDWACDRAQFRGAVIVLAKRIIPCLDVTAGRVVKGVNFVNLRDAGDPVELADRYNQQGADELVFLDITASSDARDIMANVVARTARQVFIPLTVGGGIRSVADARLILHVGRGQGLASIRRPCAGRS